MSELSWVKLSLDLFDNRKIKYIRKLPEGNNIMIIWIYSFSEPMQEKIREWIEYKDKRKEALTDISIKALLSRLQTEAQKYGDIRIIELVDESILNSWKNLQWKNLEATNNTTGTTFMDSIHNRVDVVDSWV